MKKIIYIVLLSFLLVGCGKASITYTYSENEIVLKGSSENKKHYESNIFYQEDLKKQIVDIVNEVEYSSRESKLTNETSDLVSVVIDDQEITFYKSGYIYTNDAFHKSSNSEEIYEKLDALLHDLSYEAYSYIYKRNTEEYVINTSLLFDEVSTLGSFDMYKRNLPLSYPLENSVLTSEEVVAYQNKEEAIKAKTFKNHDTSTLAVIYTGEPMNVQKEVENANIIISYMKGDTVAVRKSISLEQRCTLVIE